MMRGRCGRSSLPTTDRSQLHQVRSYSPTPPSLPPSSFRTFAGDAGESALASTLRKLLNSAHKAVATLEALVQHGPEILRVHALWAGDKPERIERMAAKDFLALVGANGLGTKTTYVVGTAI